MISYRNIEIQRLGSENKGKVKYLIGGSEYFAEEAAILNYESLGYKAIWTEDIFWWELMTLLFWDVIFAKVRGAVSVISDGVQVEIDVGDERFEQLFAQTIQMNGMPVDFFTSEFYSRRQNLIKNKIQEILHGDIEQKLNESYKNNYGKKCRPIDAWNKYKFDELLIPIKRIDKEIIVKILERLISNFNDNRTGLPDLIVYNDNEFFFSEVKSEKDRISEKQSDWHSFLSETLGLKVEIFLINRTETQVEQVEKAQLPNALKIIISFGQSSSAKREEALKFIKEQSSYFTEGEGKEQIHGAKFKTNEIDKLHTILDLTSGWKTQKIEIDGEIVKSTDLRNSLWCFKEKNKLNASSDYCKKREYDNRLNKFGCRSIFFNEFENDQWQDYGYVDTTKGEWVFDRKKIVERIEQEVNRLKYCPLLDIDKGREQIKKIPERINPQNDKNWAFIANDFEKWFWHDNHWISTYGKTNFPGFAVMVGVQKIPKKEINEAVRYSKDNDSITISYRPPTRVSKQKSGCFIATAVYGSSEEYQIKVLQSFRDNWLEKQIWGSAFINFYYRVGPYIGKYIKEHDPLRIPIRKLLNFFVHLIAKNVPGHYNAKTKGDII